MPVLKSIQIATRFQEAGCDFVGPHRFLLASPLLKSEVRCFKGVMRE